MTPDATSRPPAHDRSADAAAYALGALQPHETEAFRRHLAECVLCREEVAGFSETVDALPAAVPQYRAPRALRKRVVGAVRERPRRFLGLPLVLSPPRLASGLAAAATIGALALAVFIGTQLAGTGSRVVAASVGDAALQLSGGHGELVIHHLPPPPPGRIYELWLKRGNQAPSPTGTLFSVTRQGTANVGVPGTLSPGTAVMVTAERDGGSQAPTRAPVVMARLT